MASSPGKYKGVVINAGSDADIAKQIAAINASQSNSSNSGAAGGVTPSNNNTPTNSSTTPTPSASDALMAGIQGQLLAQSGIISSSNSTLEQRLNEAINGVQSSTVAANQAVTSAYDRQIGYTGDQAQTAITEGRTQQSGGVMNMGALRELVKQTDKNLNDLEQRKQELILQNDSAGASKIADMQMQAIQFQQTAQQQVFSNLLGMGNFALNLQQQELAKSSQSFQERSAISALGLQYGVNVQPGDTIESITQKAIATGFVGKKQALELAQIKSEINRNNAEAAKALRGDTTAVIDSGSLSVLASRWNTLSASGQTVDTSKEMENLLGTVTKAGKQSDFYKAIADDATASAKAQVAAAEAKKSQTSTTQSQPSWFDRFSADLFKNNTIPASSDAPLGWVKDRNGNWVKR